eukprot:gene14786-20836_t
MEARGKDSAAWEAAPSGLPGQPSVTALAGLDQPHQATAQGQQQVGVPEEDEYEDFDFDALDKNVAKYLKEKELGRESRGPLVVRAEPAAQVLKAYQAAWAAWTSIFTRTAQSTAPAAQRPALAVQQPATDAHEAMRVATDAQPHQSTAQADQATQAGPAAQADLAAGDGQAPRDCQAACTAWAAWADLAAGDDQAAWADRVVSEKEKEVQHQVTWAPVCPLITSAGACPSCPAPTFTFAPTVSAAAPASVNPVRNDGVVGGYEGAGKKGAVGKPPPPAASAMTPSPSALLLPPARMPSTFDASKASHTGQVTPCAIDDEDYESAAAPKLDRSPVEDGASLDDDRDELSVLRKNSNTGRVTQPKFQAGELGKRSRSVTPTGLGKSAPVPRATVTAKTDNGDGAASPSGVGGAKGGGLSSSDDDSDNDDTPMSELLHKKRLQAAKRRARQEKATSSSAPATYMKPPSETDTRCVKRRSKPSTPCSSELPLLMPKIHLTTPDLITPSVTCNTSVLATKPRRSTRATENYGHKLPGSIPNGALGMAVPTWTPLRTSDAHEEKPSPIPWAGAAGPKELATLKAQLLEQQKQAQAWDGRQKENAELRTLLNDARPVNSLPRSSPPHPHSPPPHASGSPQRDQYAPHNATGTSGGNGYTKQSDDDSGYRVYMDERNGGVFVDTAGRQAEDALGGRQARNSHAVDCMALPGTAQ